MAACHPHASLATHARVARAPPTRSRQLSAQASSILCASSSPSRLTYKARQFCSPTSANIRTTTAAHAPGPPLRRGCSERGRLLPHLLQLDSQSVPVVSQHAEQLPAHLAHGAPARRHRGVLELGAGQGGSALAVVHGVGGDSAQHARHRQCRRRGRTANGKRWGRHPLGGKRSLARPGRAIDRPRSESRRRRRLSRPGSLGCHPHLVDAAREPCEQRLRVLELQPQVAHRPFTLLRRAPPLGSIAPCGLDRRSRLTHRARRFTLGRAPHSPLPLQSSLRRLGARATRV
mmetsp:Transcript_1938/g.6407  ORF Transcript_1938/g.6407 Transcript_1938/m.6407 type:complete len:289 (-) Transcript_1938:2517-3383(-)